MENEGMRIDSSEFGEASEGVFGEKDLEMSPEDEQNENYESTEEEDDEEEDACPNPLESMVNQQLEGLGYEALAAKKRKALADGHCEGSTKKSRQDDIVGASMEEILEAMNYGNRRKRKCKKRGRKKGSRRKTNPEIEKMLGDATLHYALGDHEKAIPLLHDVIKLASTFPGSDQTVGDSYHTLGLVYSELGDEKKAMDFYTLAAKFMPKNPSLWKLLFTWSLKQGDIEEAKRCLSKAVTLDPTDVTLKSHRAAFHVELGDFKTAAELYAQIWQLCPENVEALETAAKLYIQCGLVEPFISILKEYLKAHPTDADFRVIEMLVSILMENNAHNEALKHIEETLLVCHSGRELPFNLEIKSGICHLHLENIDKAEIIFSILWMEKDRDHTDLIMEVADAFVSLKQFGSALKYYLLIEENAGGDSGLLHLKIAQSYLALKEREKAISFFYQALHALEDNIDARLTLASLLLEESKEDEAILVLSAPANTDYEYSENSGKPQPWWLNEKVKLKLGSIYRARGMLEEFVGVILPMVEESLQRLQRQKVKKRKKLSRSELCKRVKLLDEPHSDSIFRGRSRLPSNERSKANRAKKLLEKDKKLKEKKRAEAVAAGLDWQSSDSDYYNDEFIQSAKQEIREPPIPNLLKDEGGHCLLIELSKALSSLGRLWEALKIINLTMRLAANFLSPEKKEVLRSLGAQIAYKTTDPKHGIDYVKYLVQKHPESPTAWNCYYKVASRLNNRYNYKFVNGMRAKYKECVAPFIITGHQFTIHSHHQDAAREYLEAFRLAPEDPLVNLCAGTALINLSLGFRLRHKHQCIVQGLSFLQNNLRLSENKQEALYNLGRACHQVGLVDAAVSYYMKALATCQKDYPIPKLPNESEDPAAELLKSGYCDLRREIAYNLHLIFKKSGALDLARQLLKDHCTF